MPFNRSDQAIIEHRRRAVASLRLRGLTIREIVEALPKAGILNEKGKHPKPWARGTINNDLKALSEEWQEAAKESTDILKANILAELREARRAAWKADRIDLVLRGLEDERKLYGLDARIAAAGTMEDPTHTVNYTPEEWMKQQQERRTEAEQTMAMFDEDEDA